ncbi:hypothetical protein D915_007659 [Fasciola hepatica]|uniref:Low-density lipoprotein receptor domain class A n=1 Tax=Fasciola hepatica TaxID=6192 RepID=A0A4E0RK29_FASHE|nr:hypothetical protein D915_007659 [Fasciola hepatica]
MNAFTIYIFLMFQKLQLSVCNTVRFNTQECAGQPEEPMALAGAIVHDGMTPGRTTCYFGPNDPVQYVAIRIDKAELPKSLGNCPKLTLHEYSSVREELIDNTDPNLRVAMVVPADPKLLVEANCSNYEKIRRTALQTSSPGLKLQMLFDPFSSSVSELSYEFTLTSFVIGPSFNCPTGTFRCWSDRSRCIPESLTCDGVDNCFDNSDENNYLCTGRINGIPIPLFAIIIAVSFIAFVLVVTTIVFVLRKQKTKIKKEEHTWVDMTIRHPHSVKEREPLQPVIS